MGSRARDKGAHVRTYKQMQHSGLGAIDRGRHGAGNDRGRGAARGGRRCPPNRNRSCLQKHAGVAMHEREA